MTVVFDSSQRRFSEWKRRYRPLFLRTGGWNDSSLLPAPGYRAELTKARTGQRNCAGDGRPRAVQTRSPLSRTVAPGCGHGCKKKKKQQNKKKHSVCCRSLLHFLRAFSFCLFDCSYRGTRYASAATCANLHLWTRSVVSV